MSYFLGNYMLIPSSSILFNHYDWLKLSNNSYFHSNNMSVLVIMFNS